MITILQILLCYSMIFAVVGCRMLFDYIYEKIKGKEGK